MRNSNSMISMAFIFVFIYVIMPQKAYAYLDPGTGSYFLQVFLAALFGALFALKIFWKKISVFLKGIFNKPKD